MPLHAWASILLDIDHRIPYDNGGIWQRSDQTALMYGTIAVVGGSLLLGDQNELGDTFWRSLDSVVISSAIAQRGKWIFHLERPSQTSDPNKFFQSIHGWRYQLLDHAQRRGLRDCRRGDAVRGRLRPRPRSGYALEALPIYDAIAQVKTRGHRRSDVLVGWAIGTAVGIWAAHRRSPLILSWLSHGFEVGSVDRIQP